MWRPSVHFAQKAWYADESDFPWIQEGMHATASGTNLWAPTEGRRDSGGNIITNPATGGAWLSMSPKAPSIKHVD